MAKLIAFLVLFQITTLPLLGVLAQDSPFEAIMSNVMQHLNTGSDSGDDSNSGTGAIGQLLGSLLQGDNMKNLQGNEQFMNTFAEIVNPPFKENKSIAAAYRAELAEAMADELQSMSHTYAPPEPDRSLDGWLSLSISPIVALFRSTFVNSTINPAFIFQSFPSNSPNNNPMLPPSANDATLRFISSIMRQMKNGNNMPNQMPFMNMPNLNMPFISPNNGASNGAAMNLIFKMLQQMPRYNNVPPMNMPNLNMPSISPNNGASNSAAMNLILNMLKQMPRNNNMPLMNMLPMNMPPMNTPPTNMTPMNITPMNSTNKPPMNMPPMNIPSTSIPPMNMRPMNMPPMNMPPINMPSMNMPPINFPPNNQMLPGGTNDNKNDFLKTFGMPNPLGMLIRGLTGPYSVKKIEDCYPADYNANSGKGGCPFARGGGALSFLLR